MWHILKKKIPLPLEHWPILVPIYMSVSKFKTLFYFYQLVMQVPRKTQNGCWSRHQCSKGWHDIIRHGICIHCEMRITRGTLYYHLYCYNDVKRLGIVLSPIQLMSRGIYLSGLDWSVGYVTQTNRLSKYLPTCGDAFLLPSNPSMAGKLLQRMREVCGLRVESRLSHMRQIMEKMIGK